MAKRRSSGFSPSVKAPASEPEKLPFELRQAVGDNASARRLAQAALIDTSASDEVKTRARRVLDEIKLDGQQFAMFGGLLVVLVIVFSVYILKRNAELPTTPKGIPSKEILVPPAETVPAERPTGETHGTP